MPNHADVKLFVNDYLEPRLAKAGVDDPPDDLSLTDSGVIDSFGLLDLVSAAEKKFSVQIDMDSVDLEVFTTYGGFIDTIARAT